MPEQLCDGDLAASVMRARFDTRSGDADAINAVMDGYVAATRTFACRARESGVLPSGPLKSIANPGVTLTRCHA